MRQTRIKDTEPQANKRAAMLGREIGPPRPPALVREELLVLGSPPAKWQLKVGDSENAENCRGRWRQSAKWRWSTPPSATSTLQQHHAMRATCRSLAAARPRVSSTQPSPYSWVHDRVDNARGRSITNPLSARSDKVEGPLAGRSIAIKDNISYISAPTSCSSDILDGMSIDLLTDSNFTHSKEKRLPPSLQCYLCGIVAHERGSLRRADEDGRIRYGVGDT